MGTLMVYFNRTNLKLEEDSLIILLVHFIPCFPKRPIIIEPQYSPQGKLLQTGVHTISGFVKPMLGKRVTFGSVPTKRCCSSHSGGTGACARTWRHNGRSNTWSCRSRGPHCFTRSWRANGQIVWLHCVLTLARIANNPEVPTTGVFLLMFPSEELFASFETKARPRYIHEPSTPVVEWNEFEAGTEALTFGTDRKICQCELCTPDDGQSYPPLELSSIPDPARTYPFELDPFQKVSKKYTPFLQPGLCCLP